MPHRPHHAAARFPLHPQKLLNVSRGRLGGLLGRGLASLAGSACELVGAGMVLKRSQPPLLPALIPSPLPLPAALLSKDLARLQMLQLVAEALPPRAEGGAAGAAAASEPAEVAEARRLAQCARVLAWLAQQQSPGFDRPTGRYFSEQEWRSVAAKRREGAAAGGATLFLADLAAELAAHGCDAGAYPPAAPDRLLASLFLGAAPAAAAAKGGTAAGGSGTSSGALNAKLALLAYYLADGGFMQPGDVVAGLQ